MKSILLLLIALVLRIIGLLLIRIGFRLRQDGELSNLIVHRRKSPAKVSNGKELLQIVNFHTRKLKVIHYAQLVRTFTSLEVKKYIFRKNSWVICQYLSKD